MAINKNQIYVDAEKVLKRLKQIANMDLKEPMTKATELVHGQAVENAPVDTGMLKESIHMRVEDNDREVNGVVYTNNEYATYVEYGTGQVAVGTYPDMTKSLTYSNKPYWKYQDKKGNWHTTSGHEANPFMYNAVQMHKKEIKDLLGDSVKSVVRGKKG